MRAVTEAEMGNERKQLQSEVSLWRYQVNYWRQEYQKALADFRRVETALRQQQAALDDYATALAAHEQWLTGQEQEALADDEPAAAGDTFFREAPVHSHEILKHWRRREHHEQAKRQHSTVLAYWSLLHQTVAGSFGQLDVLARPEEPAGFHG